MNHACTKMIAAGTAATGKSAADAESVSPAAKPAAAESTPEPAKTETQAPPCTPSLSACTWQTLAAVFFIHYYSTNHLCMYAKRNQ